MMDMGSAMKALGAWNKFKSNHPKFPAFCKAVISKGIKEGSVVEIIFTTDEGEKIETSIKVQQSDIELFQSLAKMNMSL